MGSGKHSTPKILVYKFTGQPWPVEYMPTGVETSVYCLIDFFGIIFHKCKVWRYIAGDDRGWDGWMASPTHWTWVWVNSGSWWWTGRPGVLQFMGSQRVGHDWMTALNWTEPHFRSSRALLSGPTTTDTLFLVSLGSVLLHLPITLLIKLNFLL